MKGATLLMISERPALLVGQSEDIVARVGRAVGDIVQIAQQQPRSDFSQHFVVDEFHAQNDGGIGIHVGGRFIAVGDRDGGDDRGAAEKRLQAGGAMISQAGRVDGDGVAGVGAAAHDIEDRPKLRLDRIEPVRIDAAATERGIEEIVGWIGDENEIVIEERLQPQAHRDLHPIGIEADANPAIGRFRGGHGRNLAQHPFALVGQRAREQLPLVVERNVIRTVGGAECGHHHEHDCNSHDDADRHHNARAYVAPTEVSAGAADIGPIFGQVSHRPRVFRAPKARRE
jgi:hypothetical protein